MDEIYRELKAEYGSLVDAAAVVFEDVFADLIKEVETAKLLGAHESGRNLQYCAELKLPHKRNKAAMTQYVEALRKEAVYKVSNDDTLYVITPKTFFIDFMRENIDEIQASTKNSRVPARP
jgi:hypothetical protein